MIVSLPEMLDARERRANRQRELLGKFQKPMVSFTMNIAGPIKDSPLIRRGFDIGLEDLLQVLSVDRIPVLHREVIREYTGSEAILVVDAPACQVKELTWQLEEGTPLGRLYDMDVLSPDGEKLQRQTPRRCLICGEAAAGCARSRTHSVAQLQERTEEILTQAVNRRDSLLASRLAQQALLYEVAVTPKPGLVDRENNGSHQDMDFFTFQRSALALGPYFARCLEIGRETGDLSPEETFARLRFPGKQAEGEMLAATGGVNTHKGAIFSLGLVCGALGRLEKQQWSEPQRILDTCAHMTRDLLSQDFGALKPGPGETVGQQLFLRYGITGVRGQAASGFPEVRDIGLPKLEEGLQEGLPINDAACAALMALIAGTVDTNMIHRGGLEAQQAAAKAAAEALAKDPFPGREALEDWNRRFVEGNLSPGGCADLLAMTLMLHFLKETSHE